ncbi:FAD-dependent oxidoreductase [Vibrio sp. TH_r3]|uniref:FAD-dependent oxidoreductase n=1 Tax=unclassified Vibrio TaxID=2614977 RepID=UPI0029537A8C|nr:FAD-dependent oxidoreductase [Vibrio sp. TH_r3]MDV7105590.1 FAD-dependent oxidoreductase [Vibrio sp. TH_r3]
MNSSNYDLIIVGGGPSGVMAAVQASRMGVKTLLIERGSFLGGSLTMMGVGPMMTFHNPGGNQVVFGHAQELVDRLMKLGASPGHVLDSVTYCSTVTPFDAEAMKVVLEEMLVDSGADVLYHTMLGGVQYDGEQITGLTICNKAGISTIAADYYIDATGDGDLAFHAGLTQEKGRKSDHALQPMTMNMKVGNVNIDKIRQDVVAHPSNYCFDLGEEEGVRRVLSAERLSLKAFQHQWKKYRMEHQLDIPREYILFFETNEKNTVVINSSRIQGLDGTNPYDVTKAEIQGRRQCYQIFNFVKSQAIGFEQSTLLSTPNHIGVRETRRSIGEYILTAKDLLERTRFPDAVSQGAYPIDIHSPDKVETVTQHLDENHLYLIPMRCLYSKKCSNLVFTGRNISADAEAFAAVRVSPIAMSIGQASGAVAATAAKQRVKIDDVDYREVQLSLQQHGANLSI